jgi:shikimate kinase
MASPEQRNVFLVGMPGAGKTTIGQRLAIAMSRIFVDVDREIERRTGVRIPVIFDVEGEPGFRARESDVLAELAAGSTQIIATGGGAVMADTNRTLMKENGIVVYLDVKPEVLVQRTRSDKARPLLQVADPLAKLRQLHAQRDPLYREVADIVIHSEFGNITKLVRAIQCQVANQLSN